MSYRGSGDFQTRPGGDWCSHLLTSDPPVAVSKLADNQFRFKKSAFGDDEAIFQERDKRKSNPKSRRFNNVQIRICGISDSNPPQNESAPGRVDCASNVDFSSRRPERHFSDTLLDAIGLQVQIDAQEDNRGRHEEASRKEKNRLANLGNRGAQETFPGL